MIKSELYHTNRLNEMVEKKYNKKDYLQFSQVILEECMYIKQYKIVRIKS